MLVCSSCADKFEKRLREKRLFLWGFRIITPLGRCQYVSKTFKKEIHVPNRVVWYWVRGVGLCVPKKPTNLKNNHPKLNFTCMRRRYRLCNVDETWRATSPRWHHQSCRVRKGHVDIERDVVNWLVDPNCLDLFWGFRFARNRKLPFSVLLANCLWQCRVLLRLHVIH